MESVVAAAAEAVRTTSPATASCQRRGRNRRREWLSPSRTAIAGVGGGTAALGGVRSLLRCPPASRGPGRGGGSPAVAVAAPRSARCRGRRRASAAPRRMRRAPPPAGRRGRGRASAARGAVRAADARATSTLQLAEHAARDGRARDRSRSDPSSAVSRSSSSRATSSRPCDSSVSPASVGPRQSASASAKQLSGALRAHPAAARSPASATRTLHARRVEALGLDREPVAPAAVAIGSLAVARERLAQLGHIDVDGLPRRRRRRRRPRGRRSGARARRPRSRARAEPPRTSRSFSVPSGTGSPSSSTSSGPRIRNSTSRFYRITSRSAKPVAGPGVP